MAGALTAMIAAAFAGGVTPDPYFEYTTLLLPGSGTNGTQNNSFVDSSANAFSITRNPLTGPNAPTQGTFSPFSQTGWGNYFNGTTDNLKFSNNAAFQFGTTAFTIEFWVYLTTTSGSPQFICCYQNSSTGYNITLNASAVLTANLSGDGADITGTTTVQANQWNHIALSGTGGTSVKLFLNGVQEGSTFTGATSLSPGTYPFTIGSFAGGGFGDAAFITGYMSNVRVVKGTAVYTGNFTPPSLAPLTTAGSTSAASYPSTTNVNTSFASSETSLLTCQSNRFKDNSSNNFTITVSGSPRVVAFSPFNPSASWSAATYGGSGYFDGSGDYLTIASNSAFNLPSDFTMEAWCYFTSRNASYTSVIQYNTSVYLGTEGTQATFYADTSTAIYLKGGTIQDNAWNHIAVARSGSTVRLWLNGVSVGTATNSGTVGGATPSLWINSAANGTSFQSAGYYNGIRIVKGTAVYDPTQSTLTVPTAPLTAITNTSLLLNFTNAGIYDATSKNDLETVGDAQISNTTAKWGSTSIKFDGTGDYLISNSNAANAAFGTGNWTIEFWVYLNTTSGTQLICDFRKSTSSDLAPMIMYYSNAVCYYTNANIQITGSSISATTWTHIAVCRSSGSTKLFINGTQSGSTYTDSLTYVGFADRPVIGAEGVSVGSNPLNGYLQDVRVTKYARYTANFTAPTAAFPTL